MNQLISWLSWLNRQKIILFIASIVLCLGSIFPWYQLPSQGLELFGVNLFFVNIGRLLALVVSIFCFISIFYRESSHLLRIVFWFCLALVLLFPYFVTTWSPSVTFLAAAYSNQNVKVSTHIVRNFPEVQAQWKQNISLDRSKPLQTIFDLTIEDSRFFQMPSWDRLWLDGFGYKNTFFAFIGAGWGFTIIGLVVSLLGLYLKVEKDSLNDLLVDLSKFLPSIGILITVLICFLIWVNLVNYNLEEHFAKGEYKEVVVKSKNLSFLYPPLIGDTFFIERLAKAGLYANLPEQSLIYFVKGLEHYRLDDFKIAEDYFQKSLSEQPKNFLVRGYLASTLLNRGADYFNDSAQINSRRPGGAIELFEQVLTVFPDHVEALYDLMISRVVNGEFDKSSQIAKQIIDRNKYLQVSNIALVSQAYLHLTWNDFSNNDIARAWKHYRNSIDDSSWKKSSEEKP